jgi:hypothetical protein
MESDAIDTVPCKYCAELERRNAAQVDLTHECERRRADATVLAQTRAERLVALDRILERSEQERLSYRALLEEALLFGSPRVTRKGELLGFLADLDWTRRVESALGARIKK